MSRITRPLAAALSLVMLWFLAMVLETLRVPVWALLMLGGLLLVNVLVLLASIHQATRESDGQDGDGGLRRHRPEAPDSGGGGEPSWWPEFEGELARYLAEHEQDERPERLPAGVVKAT